MEARINRALNQRLYFISSPSPDLYQIAGLTNEYDVKIDIVNDEHTCTCMDFKNRQEPCKHIFFVLFRLLRFDKDEWLVGKSFDYVTKDDTKKRRQLETEDTECAICYEEFNETEITYCDECGHRFHTECLTVWLKHAPQSTCPQCRTTMKRSTKKRRKVIVIDD